MEELLNSKIPNCDYSKHLKCIIDYEKNYIIDNYEVIDTLHTVLKEVPIYIPRNYKYKELYIKDSLYNEIVDLFKEKGYECKCSYGSLNIKQVIYYNINEDKIETQIDPSYLILNSEDVILSFIKITDEESKTKSVCIRYIFDKESSKKISEKNINLGFINDIGFNLITNPVDIEDNETILELRSIYVDSNEKIIKLLENLKSFIKLKL